jgi:NAD(P)-dependent dehydrogenase (short-subunit alcohol dehydrogenase family)
MALKLAAEGNNVIITYHSNKTEADAVVATIQGMGQKAAALQLDAGDAASIKPFMDIVAKTLQAEFNTDKFDFLINNAGMGQTIAFADTTEEDVDKFYNVHYKAVFFITQYALPIMNDGGRIINLSSGTTRFANPGYHIYASMKSAVETLTRYLAKDLGSRQITVNVVAPGPIETDFNGAAIRNNPAVKERLSSVTPLGRVGTPDDVGGVVAFLCSDAGGWVNGQRIEVSGGINL